MRLALYEPDIPQNAGAILRLAACLGVGVDIIEPAGFAFDSAKLRRAGLDMGARAAWKRHPSLEAFLADRARTEGRIVLLTTRAERTHLEMRYDQGDTLLLGRESSGVPEGLRSRLDCAVRIPMVAGMRSLNVAVSAAIVLGEALRQTGAFPAPPPLKEDAP